MAGVIRFLREGLTSLYSPEHATSVLLWVIVLTLASAFIYYFYKSTSKRDLLSLNLKKYNYSEHPTRQKFLAFVLYFLEYILIIPFLILIWFAALSIVLLFIAKNRTLDQVLLVAAAVIGATRVLSYYHSEISKDLAKLFPLITLSVFLLSPGDFSFQMIKDQFFEIPALLEAVFSYMLVVILIEIILRLLYSFVMSFKRYDLPLKRGDE